MRNDTPEIDTTARAGPAAAEEPHPGLAATAIAWVQLAGITAAANLVIYAIADAVGAQMSADLGGGSQAIGPIPIVAVTLGTLFISTFVWSLVAHRVPAFAYLWVPIGWGVGLISLGGILGAAGISTGIALAIMHLLTTTVAAHLIPRRLPR